MIPTPRPATRGNQNAFTLVELLVVIGIIIILMGILLPVINRIRRAGYIADTSNEISQISNACNQYYTTFHAFPGPLSNDYIESTGTTPSLLTARPLEILLPSTTIPAATYDITGSENLVLGLMGGLRLDPKALDTTVVPNAPMNILVPTEVGLGPLNLNANLPGRTPSFFPNGTTYLMWCESTQRVGRGQPGQGFQTNQFIANNTAGTVLMPVPFVDPANDGGQDSPIPEFVDRFPTPGPLPILYLRARVGAKGIVSDGIVTDPTLSPTGPALYQYDVREIAAYTMPNSATGTSIGLGTSKQHNLQGVKQIWNLSPPSGQAPRYITVSEYPGIDTTTPHNNAGPYFANSAIPPTNSTSGDTFVNNTGHPRAVDQFILISAGPDGIYGTADDITSFGDVSQ